MPSYDLSDLLARTNENLDVEFKAWMDPRDNETRAKLARHLAALANHGGGYLVFGVDDKARTPLGATELDLALFSQDAITGIVRKYLDPRFSSSTSCMKGLRIRLSWFPHTGAPCHCDRRRTTGQPESPCRRVAGDNLYSGTGTGERAYPRSRRLEYVARSLSHASE
ncbi:AlbA family DNA-binding domain-containing protein [Bradyrhizobium japonicum]|uniref:AlbA family DNA-binding domain-containing protein n=1 Tax=Bradyrhizobium japonicum TaxID=375 RepID=UPI0033971B87